LHNKKTRTAIRTATRGSLHPGRVPGHTRVLVHHRDSTSTRRLCRADVSPTPDAACSQAQARNLPNTGRETGAEKGPGDRSETPPSLAGRGRWASDANVGHKCPANSRGGWRVPAPPLHRGGRHSQHQTQPVARTGSPAEGTLSSGPGRGLPSANENERSTKTP
jgi:hypothetical protein